MEDPGSESTMGASGGTREYEGEDERWSCGGKKKVSGDRRHKVAICEGP